MPLDPALTPLRCEACATRPMLAAYGRDERGRLFLDILVYKQHRVYSHTRVYSGEVRLLCRICNRWHRVRLFNSRQPRLEALPDSTESDVTTPARG